MKGGYLIKIRDRSISRFEVETLFTDVLNMRQIENIGNLLKILGIYVFLDREQLDYFSEIIFGAKIGLSYIKRAVKYNLVSEIQADSESDKYYFQLKAGGFYFLENIGFQYRRLNLDAGRKERQQILSTNRYLIEKKYLLDVDYEQGLLEPLFVKSNIILVVNHDISVVAESIRQSLFGKGSSIEEVYAMFKFEKIELPREQEFRSDSKGNVESMLI